MSIVRKKVNVLFTIIFTGQIRGYDSRKYEESKEETKYHQDSYNNYGRGQIFYKFFA